MDRRKENNKIIDEGFIRSIALLKKNSGRYGVLASSPSKRAGARNYLSIFGRDGSISAIGMAASQNRELIRSAKKSLLTLSRHQADNGQIPNYVKPEKNYRDFWYTGCIDATLWWLIAVKYFDIYSAGRENLERKLKSNIALALWWLRCREHNSYYLLEQNEASDWADIMPRKGFVLYTNSLWFWVKSLYSLDHAKETKESFNYFFDPGKKIPDKYFKKNPRAKRLLNRTGKKTRGNLLFSWIDLEGQGTDMDVYGNILACLAGAVDKKRAAGIVGELFKLKADRPFPARACLAPIKKNGKNWRSYMLRHNQNLPYQYHNGGAWPFIGGFFIIAAIKYGKKDRANKSMINLAAANKTKNWQFNEWFHGLTGKPMGMPGQSWNAAAYILSYQALKNKIKI